MTATGDPRHACGVAVPSLLAAGLGAYLVLHFVEPPLAITWSFAHLGRSPAFWWTGAVLVVLVPAATWLAWEHPRLQAPARSPSWPAVVALGGAVWVLLAWIGLAHPAPELSLDADYFVTSVRYSAQPPLARWYLTVWTFRQLKALAGRAVTTSTLVYCTNAFLATVALLALAGCAWRLARTRGEALALTGLAWTAFGTLQLAFGYGDVYPAALVLLALFLWSGLRALQGDLHPGWPLTLAAVAPFWYLGLALLAPAALVLAAHVMRTSGGHRRLLTGLAVALAAAGVATVPGYGAPFAWLAFARSAATASAFELGLSPTSSLLPASHMLSGTHAREVVHTLLLVDGVGVLFALVVSGAVLARRTWDPAVALLASCVLPYLAYVVAFDPVFGAFADWDLFSYGAAATSLLGAYVFVLWGRASPRPFALLLGLALAASGVHLLARLNALDVAIWEHLRESPEHKLRPPPPPRVRVPVPRPSLDPQQ